MRRSSSTLGLLAVLAAVPLAAQAPAQSFAPTASFAGFNDWIGSETKGVRIGADGRLQLAPALRRVAQLPEGVIWSAVADGAGGAYLSAGTDGKLFRFGGGQMRPLAQVKGGIVFAMARMGQDLIVAPSGEGKLFRVNPAGDVKPFADIDAKLVWALSVQGGDVTVAGGGEKGAVLILAREGSSRRLAELPEETAFTAMAADGQGGWYLGSHGRGLVVRYAAERLETLMDTPFEEVRSLVFHEGQLYVGASSGVSNRYASGNLERREGYLSEPGSGAKGVVIRLDRERVPETLWQSTQSQIFALYPWKDQILVCTGNRSRIFAVPMSSKTRDAEPFSVLQDLGTGQATGVLPLGSELLLVGSNPAELHQLSEAQATEGTLESRVLKGNPLADWGRAYLDAEAPTGTAVELQFRVGSTETPDSTWSPWTPPLRSGERPSLKPARAAQFRLRLTSTRGGASPIVEGVRLHWANRNLAPQWEGIEIMPPGLVITRTGPPEDIGIERVPVETQKLIPALSYAGSEKRSFRRAAQAFIFKASDPNGDQFSFRIQLIPERGTPIELEKAWKEKFFTFDTLPVPDGKYRLEVTASDAPSQPFNGALATSLRTPPFFIDHTPPVIAELAAQREGDGLRVRFTARDETSTLKEAMVAGDGDGWLHILPEDRVFDAGSERFDVLIPRDRVRGDRILVRVVDSHNNEQSAMAVIDAPKKR